MVQAAGAPALVYLLPHKRNLTYAFVQDEWSFTRDWTLTAGVRHDQYSDFGKTTNPRLVLVWDAAPFWQLGTTLNHVAGRMREPGDTRALIPDYTTVDMNLRREKFAGGWDARATVTKLFDRKAWEPTFLTTGMPSDLPLPGRAFYIEIQHKL